MAEKRRCGVTAEQKSAKTESDDEFLSQAGVSAMLRAALLKLLEARPEDPIGFLAEHFTNEASETESSGGGDGGDGDGGRDGDALEEQQLNKALWHLSLVHHSQRSAFNNNIRLAYDLLSQSGSTRTPGSVRGKLYTEMLRCVCSDRGLTESAAAPLLRRLTCRDYEAVPFELFRNAVLTCASFSEYVRRARCLYAAVACCPERPAERELCNAVLGALREALETSDGPDATRYLEASAKISPAELARAMAKTRGASRQQEGPSMDMREFEDTATALFIARVRVVN